MKLLTKINTVTLVASAYLISAFPALAVVNLDPCGSGGTSSNVKSKLCGITGDKAGPLVTDIIVIALIIAAVIALAFLIWGGIKWIMSGGDKAKVESARSMIIAAIIGLIITFLAYFILTVVLKVFGLGLTDLNLPSIPDNL